MHVLATLCPEDPPGWSARTPFYHGKLLLNTPEMREAAAQYLRHVVGRYKDHPAQGLWSLANEPAGLAQSFDQVTMQQFGQWLQGQYGSLDALNRALVPPDREFRSRLDRAGPGNGQLDRLHGAGRLEAVPHPAAVRPDRLGPRSGASLDTKHLTHVNPSALAYNMPADGADAWSQKRVVDVLGTTMHASWQVPEYRPSDTDLGFALITDLLRSASGASPWWITELQAGPAVLCALRPTAPRATNWPAGCGTTSAPARRASSSGAGTPAVSAAKEASGDWSAPTPRPRRVPKPYARLPERWPARPAFCTTPSR